MRACVREYLRMYDLRTYLRTCIRTFPYVRTEQLCVTHGVVSRMSLIVQVEKEGDTLQDALLRAPVTNQVNSNHKVGRNSSG